MSASIKTKVILTPKLYKTVTAAEAGTDKRFYNVYIISLSS